ncbi:MAG: nitroreductase family protein [Candidatus Thorarchaeota archaeon]
MIKDSSSTRRNKPELSNPRFFDVIRGRRSIRRYKEFDIPDKDIAAIIDAARLAPSAENSQPWRFLVVKEKGMKEVLAETASGQRFIAEANAVIMVLGLRSASCCPSNPARWYVQDPMIAAEHLVLAATALGYGTCWVAMLETRPTRAIEIVKEALGIPEDALIISLVTVGVPDEAPSARPRKSIQEIAFMERYGEPLIPNQ